MHSMLVLMAVGALLGGCGGSAGDPSNADLPAVDPDRAKEIEEARKASSASDVEDEPESEPELEPEPEPELQLAEEADEDGDGRPDDGTMPTEPVDGGAIFYEPGDDGTVAMVVSLVDNGIPDEVEVKVPAGSTVELTVWADQTHIGELTFVGLEIDGDEVAFSWQGGGVEESFTPEEPGTYPIVLDGVDDQPISTLVVT